MNLNVINESKISRFQAAIDQHANMEIDRCLNEIRESNSAGELVRVQSEERKELAKIRAERNAAETRIKKELSRCSFEIDRAVLSHRQELIGSFFEEIKGELLAFAASDRYDEYLRRSLEKAKQTLGDFVVFAKAADVDKVKALTQNEVRADSGIVIGGICAMNEQKALYADLTLDNALNEEREAFAAKNEIFSQV